MTAPLGQRRAKRSRKNSNGWMSTTIRRFGNGWQGWKNSVASYNKKSGGSDATTPEAARKHLAQINCSALIDERGEYTE